MFLQAMSEDYTGALLEANKEVEEAEEAGRWCCRELTRRGFVKRLSRDLPGALEDLNAAAHPRLQEMENYRSEMRYDILKHRGYVKHLMGDDIGAKEDAEAAQKLRFTDFEAIEKTVDCRNFGDFTKLPINYLGYFL